MQQITSTVNRVSKPKFLRLGWKQSVMGYMFLVPTILLFLVFTVLPFILSIFYSFTDFNLSIIRNIEGFSNYVTALKDTQFLRSFLNVFIYAVMFVPLSIITSLLAAVLVNSKGRGVKFFRVVYYIPAVTSGVAVAYIWKWMYSYDGLFNMLTGVFGIAPSRWVSAPNYFAMFSIVLVAVWNGLGGNMLIFLAALKSVPDELYEAADIDGASSIVKLKSITLPSIAPTMYFILTMTIIGAFQMFDLVYLMVADPLSLTFTRTPVMEIYTKGFNQSRGGLGTAMSVILLCVILIATFVTQRFFKEDASA